MIDILTGRCPIHDLLSSIEIMGNFCVRCEDPHGDDEGPDDEDWLIKWENKNDFVDICSLPL